MSEPTAAMRILADMVALARAEDDDSLEVLAVLSARLVAGNRAYGKLGDKEYTEQSAIEEAADGFVYCLNILKRLQLRNERRQAFPEEDRL